MALRWGIVGAGKISHDFANAIGTLSDDEHVIVAVAARDLTRAQDFAQLHEIPKSYDSYEDLAKDADVGKNNNVIDSISPLTHSICRNCLHWGHPSSPLGAWDAYA